VDLLHDFYCLTGSQFARDELALLGEQLKAMLGRSGPFFDAAFSSRGEGWCMKGLVLCHLVTGDPALRELARDRLHRVLDRDRGKGAWRFAVAQAPHPVVLDGATKWDAPWQQAAFVLGMHAGARFFEDPLFAELAVDVAFAMAGAGWVEGVGPKYFVDVADPARFALEIGEHPLGGTALQLSPALVVAAELVRDDPVTKARILRRAFELFEPYRIQQATSGLPAESKWLQVFLDRYPQGAVGTAPEAGAGR
jgi:hypothetical protein